MIHVPNLGKAATANCKLLHNRKSKQKSLGSKKMVFTPQLFTLFISSFFKLAWGLYSIKNCACRIAVQCRSFFYLLCARYVYLSYKSIVILDIEKLPLILKKK